MLSANFKLSGKVEDIDIENNLGSSTTTKGVIYVELKSIDNNLNLKNEILWSSNIEGIATSRGRLDINAALDLLRTVLATHVVKELSTSQKVASILKSRNISSSPSTQKNAESSSYKVLQDASQAKPALSLLISSEKKGNYEKSERNTATLTTECWKAKDLVNEGDKYLSDNPKKAEQFYSNAVKECPNSANAHYNLGLALLNQKKYSDAVSAFDKALSIQSNFAEAMIGKAFALVDGNIDPDRGEGLAKEALAMRSNDSKLAELAAILEKPKYPAHLTTELSFSEPSGKNMLYAGDGGVLKVVIKNSGKGAAKNVRADIRLENDIKGFNLQATEINVGKIDPGSEVIKTLQISTIEDDLQSAEARIRVDVVEQYGFDADPVAISFKTKELTPPDLKVVDVGIENSSGGNIIHPTEIVEITARIQNKGQGDAREVSANIKPGENVFFTGDSKKEFDIGNLDPGKFKDIKFSIYTNKKATGVPLSIDLSEKRKRYDRAEPLSLAFNKPQKLTKDIIVTAKDDSRKTDIPDVANLSVDIDNPPLTKVKNPDAIAVVIGNKNYMNKDVPTADYAISDAEVMKEYLVKTMGFREGNIIYKTDITFAEFREIFGTESNHKGSLYNYIKQGKSDVFIYYSGHGTYNTQDVKDKKSVYFLPVDASPNAVTLNGYPLEVFYNNLSKIKQELLPRKMTVVIDFCFSGGSEKGMLLKGSMIYVEVENPLMTLPDTVVFTSASGSQISSWYPEKRHSMFTYFFLKAIKDKVEKGSGELSIKDIESYVKDEVPYAARRLHNGRLQTPEVIGNRSSVFLKY